ncbi:MAG: hypothetical protein WBG62_21925 [Cyclobacteriaceae bacterium]
MQWKPKNNGAPKTPDAHEEGKMNELMMTSELAMKVAPKYGEVCGKFLNDFDYFTEAFSRSGTSLPIVIWDRKTTIWDLKCWNRRRTGR